MTTLAHITRKVGLAGRKRSMISRRETAWGLFFLSPWIIGFLAFTFLPMIASLVFSFTNFNLIHPEEIRFIGLENYALLTRDPLVRVALWVSIRFGLIVIPVSLAFPLAVAALLNARPLLGKRLFQTLFYLPNMVPVISAVYIWAGMLNTETGWVNMALKRLGLPGPDWLNSVTWIYLALTLMGLWGMGSTMVILLAGMQGVPTELYEAAKVDGASPLRSFISITIPMITPVIFYNLTLSLIGLFQYFTAPFALNSGSGGPGNATLFYNVYLYKTAFGYVNMGYGATLAWLLFIITLALTLLLFRSAKFWVFYAGGEA